MLDNLFGNINVIEKAAPAANRSAPMADLHRSAARAGK
jgi:hypothetical protein